MLPSQTPAHTLEFQAPATRVSHSIGTRPVPAISSGAMCPDQDMSATLRAHPEYGALGGMSMTRTAPTSYRNFINGQWVDASASGTLENRNPANQDDVIGVLPRSTRRGCERRGGRGARPRWPGGAWSPRPDAPSSCIAPLKSWRSKRQVHARTMTRGMGKILDESRGDIQEAIDMSS